MTSSYTLPPAPSSVRTARAETAHLLQHWGDAETRHAAVLMVSELVTNAVLHARTQLELVVDVRSDDVRIEVADGNVAEPLRREVATDRPGGRGLQLLDALATRWGVQQGRTGKSVWFELAPTV